jgi:hypothetical protein
VTLNLLRLHAVHTFLRQKNSKRSEDRYASEKGFGTTKRFAQVFSRRGRGYLQKAQKLEKIKEKGT